MTKAHWYDSSYLNVTIDANTVKPQISGLIGTSVNSPDN